MLPHVLQYAELYKDVLNKISQCAFILLASFLSDCYGYWMAPWKDHVVKFLSAKNFYVFVCAQFAFEIHNQKGTFMYIHWPF